LSFRAKRGIFVDFKSHRGLKMHHYPEIAFVSGVSMVC